MTLIADVFPKLRTPENLVRSMSKKTRFKGSFEKQHGKRAQTLLKLAWQHLYDIYWSLWRQLTCKRSLVVTCKISRLFPKTLCDDAKFSLFNRSNLTEPILMQVSGKEKTFSQFFTAFYKSSLNLEHFQKKRCLSYLRYFRNYGLRKIWLHQCLKSPVSRDPSKSNMVNARKHCWNVKASSFSIFIDHCEGNWLSKSLC